MNNNEGNNQLCITMYSEEKEANYPLFITLVWHGVCVSRTLVVHYVSNIILNKVLFAELCTGSYMPLDYSSTTDTLAQIQVTFTYLWSPRPRLPR